MPYRFGMLLEHLHGIAPVQFLGDSHMDSVVDRYITYLVCRVKDRRRAGQQDDYTDQD